MGHEAGSTGMVLGVYGKLRPQNHIFDPSEEISSPNVYPCCVVANQISSLVLLLCVHHAVVGGRIAYKCEGARASERAERDRHMDRDRDRTERGRQSERETDGNRERALVHVPVHRSMYLEKEGLRPCLFTAHARADARPITISSSSTP